MFDLFDLDNVGGNGNTSTYRDPFISNQYNLDVDAKDSVGTVNGTVFGGLTFTNDTDLGNCANFVGDATQFIDMGDNFDLGTDSCGFSVWLKSSPYPLLAKATIFAKSLYGGVANRYYLQARNRNIDFTIVDNKKVAYRASSGNIYKAIGLMYVYVNIDRDGFLSIHIDGVRQANAVDLTPMQGQNITNNYPFLVGKYNNTDGGNGGLHLPYNGKMVTLEKHNISRTDASITALYNQEKLEKGI